MNFGKRIAASWRCSKFEIHQRGANMRQLLLVGIFIAAGCGVTSGSSPSLGQASSETQLKWLDSATAEVWFRRDVGRKRYRFYVVHGFASMIPAVGHDAYERCYRTIERTLIEGTGDVIESPEHSRLNRLATAFASEYNRLMKRHIDEMRGKSCPSG